MKNKPAGRMSWKAWTELNHDAANLNNIILQMNEKYCTMKNSDKNQHFDMLSFNFLKKTINLSSLQNEFIDRGNHKTNRVVFLTSFGFFKWIGAEVCVKFFQFGFRQIIGLSCSPLFLGLVFYLCPFGTHCQQANSWLGKFKSFKQFLF